MMDPAKYLELSTIEELADKLKAEGYTVSRPDEGLGPAYDLVAEKPGRKIAVEVKSRTSLRGASDEIAHLRQAAREQGFDSFRLVVASPPHRTGVEIADLEQSLLTHLLQNVPPELDALSSRSVPLDVEQIDFDRLEIRPEEIHVIGDGVVLVELNHGGGEARDGVTWTTSFPFGFDVILDRALQIQHVNHLDVDTSSFYE